MTTKKEKFLALKVDSLPLSKHTKVWLIRNATPDEHSWEQAQVLATHMSVADIILGFPPIDLSFDGRHKHRELVRSIPYQRVRRLFVSKGLTRLDWHHLPQRTVTPTALKKLHPAVLLELPAVLLGTFSAHSLSWLDLEGATVEQLLNAELRSDRHKGFRKGIKKTQDLLRTLGLNEGDGAFMAINSLRGKAEELMRRYNLSRPLALRVVKIAQAEHWLSGRFT